MLHQVHAVNDSGEVNPVVSKSNLQQSRKLEEKCICCI
jgi:hypothetical protein